jgi:glutamyl/glutaminyl-tRNA synthetase
VSKVITKEGNVVSNEGAAEGARILEVLESTKDLLKLSQANRAIFFSKHPEVMKALNKDEIRRDLEHLMEQEEKTKTQKKKKQKIKKKTTEYAEGAEYIRQKASIFFALKSQVQNDVWRQLNNASIDLGSLAQLTALPSEDDPNLAKVLNERVSQLTKLILVNNVVGNVIRMATIKQVLYLCAAMKRLGQLKTEDQWRLVYEGLEISHQWSYSTFTKYLYVYQFLKKYLCFKYWIKAGPDS